MSRIDSLKGMIEQDPANSRFRYMLAMEFVNGGNLQAAIDEFEKLLAADSGYSAAYFHGGQTLEKLGRNNAAREMYERGIEATTRNGDHHTRSELQGALELLS